MKKHLVNRFVLRHDEKEFRLSLFHKPSKDVQPVLIARPTMTPEIALMLMYALQRNVREYEGFYGRIRPRYKNGKFSEQMEMLLEMR